jgi:hypothetical protein
MLYASGLLPAAHFIRVYDQGFLGRIKQGILFRDLPINIDLLIPSSPYQIPLFFFIFTIPSAIPLTTGNRNPGECRMK